MLKLLFFLALLPTTAHAQTPAAIAFGDSITAGDGTISWPSILAGRTGRVVLNRGVPGNWLSSDLGRFEGVIDAWPGLPWIFLLEGINDIGQTRGGTLSEMSAADLIADETAMINYAHMYGVKVIGCTLTPFYGSIYYTDQGEAIRQQFNAWIRTTPLFDKVMDFDAIVRDPWSPREWRGHLSDDNLHPNTQGHWIMGNAIDAALF